MELHSLIANLHGRAAAQVFRLGTRSVCRGPHSLVRIFHIAAGSRAIVRAPLQQVWSTLQAVRGVCSRLLRRKGRGGWRSFVTLFQGRNGRKDLWTTVVFSQHSTFVDGTGSRFILGRQNEDIGIGGGSLRLRGSRNLISWQEGGALEANTHPKQHQNQQKKKGFCHTNSHVEGILSSEAKEGQSQKIR